MTQEEIERAAERLIKEANRKSTVKKRQYEEECYAEECRAAERRAARSSILENILGRLKTEFDDAVALIQSELDEKLEELYEKGDGGSGGGGDPGGGEDAPYEVDYSLPMRERYITVRDYYLAYEDKQQALADFREDEIAQDYLGSYYNYVLQLLMTMV